MHYSIMTHIGQALAAVGAILASEAAVLGNDGWIASVEKLGLAVVLVVFFVATGWMREQRMAKRIDWLEKENDKMGQKVAMLTEQVNKTMSSVITKVTGAIEKLDHRTCFAFETREEFDRARAAIARRAARHEADEAIP